MSLFFKGSLGKQMQIQSVLSTPLKKKKKKDLLGMVWVAGMKILFKTDISYFWLKFIYHCGKKDHSL